MREIKTKITFDGGAEYLKEIEEIKEKATETKEAVEQLNKSLERLIELKGKLL